MKQPLCYPKIFYTLLFFNIFYINICANLNAQRPIFNRAEWLTPEYVRRHNLASVAVVDRSRFESGFAQDVNYSYMSLAFNPDNLVGRMVEGFRPQDTIKSFTQFYYNKNQQVLLRRFFKNDSLRHQSIWTYTPEGKLVGIEDNVIIIAHIFLHDRTSFRWIDDTLRKTFDIEQNKIETARFKDQKMIERENDIGKFRIYYTDSGKKSHETVVSWDGSETEVLRYHYDTRGDLIRIETSDTDQIFERDASGLILRESTRRKIDGTRVYGGSFDYSYQYR
jgi:hypothetical protein